MALKPFDTALAESGQQSTLDQLRKDFKYDEAKSLYERTGQLPGQSSSSSSSGVTADFSKIAADALKMQQAANKPAIQSLQASIPEVGQKFETERERLGAEIDPLKERYSNLLAEVTGVAKTREEAQTRVTSGELGKRGIVGSSTLAQDEINRAVDPIRAGLQTATKDIGLAQEEGLRHIQSLISNTQVSEVEQKRAIQNAIAQLEAGGGQAAINQALQILQLQQTSQSQQASLDLQRQQQALADKVFQQISLPESAANLANIQSQIANRGSESGGNLNQYLDPVNLQQQFGGLNLSFGSNVYKLLEQGKVNEAIALALNP